MANLFKYKTSLVFKLFLCKYTDEDSYTAHECFWQEEKTFVSFPELFIMPIQKT